MTRTVPGGSGGPGLVGFQRLAVGRTHYVWVNELVAVRVALQVFPLAGFVGRKEAARNADLVSLVAGEYVGLEQGGRVELGVKATVRP